MRNFIHALATDVISLAVIIVLAGMLVGAFYGMEAVNWTVIIVVATLGRAVVIFMDAKEKSFEA